MKNLFILVLLGNVVFYLWVSNVQPESTQSNVTVMNESLEPMLLIGELNLVPEVDEIEAATVTVKSPVLEKTAPPSKKEKILPLGGEGLRMAAKDEITLVPALTCMQTSNVKEKQIMVDLQSWLAEKRVLSELIERDVIERRGYWVMYPAAENMGQARANVRLLKNKGASDYWLFRKGSKKGAISLGMFKGQKKANKVKREWAKKGIELDIKPHELKEEQFSLVLTGGMEVEKLFEQFQKSLKGDVEIKIRNIPCN